MLGLTHGAWQHSLNWQRTACGIESSNQDWKSSQKMRSQKLSVHWKWVWASCWVESVKCLWPSGKCTSLPDQRADNTMPPPTASPAEKGSRPPTFRDIMDMISAFLHGNGLFLSVSPRLRQEGMSRAKGSRQVISTSSLHLPFSKIFILQSAKENH